MMSSATEEKEYNKYLDGENRSNGLNLYHITDPKGGGWETYDSMVVAAKSATQARTFNPGDPDYKDDTWEDHINDVTVIFIGVAIPELEEGVVITSFNAG